MRKHIFNAGPCKLPDSTLENVSKAVLEFGNTGQSIMEVSHRSADFQAVYDEAVALFKEVLNIPEGYSVLFLGGGASMQFLYHGKYYVKEEVRKPGYLPNEEIWEIDASYTDQNLAEIKLTKEVENQPTESQFTKTDATTGEELEGAKLQIIDKEIGRASCRERV